MAVEDYELIVGLEVHAELSTKTKIFVVHAQQNLEQKPNTHICPVCMHFQEHFQYLMKKSGICSKSQA